MWTGYGAPEAVVGIGVRGGCASPIPSTQRLTTSLSLLSPICVYFRNNFGGDWEWEFKLVDYLSLSMHLAKGIHGKAYIIHAYTQERER